MIETPSYFLMFLGTLEFLLEVVLLGILQLLLVMQDHERVIERGCGLGPTHMVTTYQMRAGIAFDLEVYKVLRLLERLILLRIMG